VIDLTEDGRDDEAGPRENRAGMDVLPDSAHDDGPPGGIRAVAQFLKLVERSAESAPSTVALPGAAGIARGAMTARVSDHGRDGWTADIAPTREMKQYQVSKGSPGTPELKDPFVYDYFTQFSHAHPPAASGQ